MNKYNPKLTPGQQGKLMQMYQQAQGQHFALPGAAYKEDKKQYLSDIISAADQKKLTSMERTSTLKDMAYRNKVAKEELELKKKKAKKERKISEIGALADLANLGLKAKMSYNQMKFNAAQKSFYDNYNRNYLSMYGGQNSLAAMSYGNPYSQAFDAPFNMTAQYSAPYNAPTPYAPGYVGQTYSTVNPSSTALLRGY